MIPQTFWQPWAEIDPALRHGGIEDPSLERDFVGPRLGDNPQTLNPDMLNCFRTLNDAAASLSVHPESDLEGPLPMRNFVEETLLAYNQFIERVMDRTKTTATSFFNWTHARPPVLFFRMRPVRFPVRNELAYGVIYHCLGTMVEMAELNANGLHSCLDPSSGARALSGVLHNKATIVKDCFDLEVQNEITVIELGRLFEGVEQPGPVIVPAGESAPAPDAAAVAQAKEGLDLLQWFPSEADWARFAKKQAETYKAERLYQPEGARPFTEDIANENPVEPAPPGGVNVS